MIITCQTCNRVLLDQNKISEFVALCECREKGFEVDAEEISVKRQHGENYKINRFYLTRVFCSTKCRDRNRITDISREMKDISRDREA